MADAQDIIAFAQQQAAREQPYITAIRQELADNGFSDISARDDDALVQLSRAIIIASLKASNWRHADSGTVLTRLYFFGAPEVYINHTKTPRNEWQRTPEANAS